MEKPDIMMSDKTGLEATERQQRLSAVLKPTGIKQTNKLQTKGTSEVSSFMIQRRQIQFALNTFQK